MAYTPGSCTVDRNCCTNRVMPNSCSLSASCTSPENMGRRFSAAGDSGSHGRKYTMDNACTAACLGMRAPDTYVADTTSSVACRNA